MFFLPLRPRLLILICSYFVLSYAPSAFALSEWEFNPETSQLQFTLEDSLTPTYFFLDDPKRIVIDIPKTQLEGDSIQQNYQGLIQEIRIGQFEEETARIVLELAPGATLASDEISLTATDQGEEKQWQFQPTIEKVEFPLSTLMTIPSLAEKTVISSQQQVQVPSPPSEQARSSQESSPELTLPAGTEFQVRYRGETPLKLEVDQPWQEVLFLESELTNEEGELIASNQTPVIGKFETTSEGTRFVTQALITTVEPTATRELNTVIPLKAHSSLINNPESKSSSNQITICPDTLLTLELREDWNYQR